MGKIKTKDAQTKTTGNHKEKRQGAKNERQWTVKVVGIFHHIPSIRRKRWRDQHHGQRPKKEEMGNNDSQLTFFFCLGRKNIEIFPQWANCKLVLNKIASL